MANRGIVFVSAVLLVVVLSATDSRAAIYHVGPKGSDNAEGTGDAPWQTLAKAVYSAAPGDTILLAAGSYAFKLPKKPFDREMVTIRPAADAVGKVTVTGFKADYDGLSSFLRFEGLNIESTIRIHKASWVQFVRCKFTGSSHWGVAFIESEHVGLYGCDIATDTGSQVMIGGPKHAEYRFNEVTNGTADAFQGNGDDILIEGNWVHDMRRAPKAHPDGLQLGNTRRFVLRGNVFDCPDMQTLFFSWTKKETTYEDIVIENNVCTTAQVHGLTISPSTDLLVRNNLITCDPKHKYSTQSINLKNMKGKCTVQNNILDMFGMAARRRDTVTNNLVLKKHWSKDSRGSRMPETTSEALFVDRAKRDYRLKDDSPAVGAAAPGTVPAVDILGRERPKDKPSIGPLERLPGDDKPFMEMWKAYFRKIQAEVKPPDPPTS